MSDAPEASEGSTVTGTRRFDDGSGWQVQAGYSRAVRRGNVISISGTTATGPDGAALHPGDTGAQARVCLDRIVQALTALGASVDDLVRTVVYLAPGASWEQSKKVEAVLTASVPIDHRVSMYARWGDWVPATCWLSLAVGLVFGRLRPARAK